MKQIEYGGRLLLWTRKSCADHGETRMASGGVIKTEKYNTRVAKIKTWGTQCPLGPLLIIGGKVLFGVIVDKWGARKSLFWARFCGDDIQHLGARLFTTCLEHLRSDVEALKVQPACSGAEPDRHVKPLAAGQQHAWLP